MTALIIIACVLGYMGVGAWAHGRVCHELGYGKIGWATEPSPFFASIFWPILFVVYGIKQFTVPIRDLGYAYQGRQLAKQDKKLAQKRKRIADQEKVRIELKKAEEILRQEERQAELELEAQFRELDKEEVKHKQVYRQLDQVFFGKKH